MKVHPDKNQSDPEATQNFQNLNHAYKILIDDEKRKIYDQTGMVYIQLLFFLDFSLNYLLLLLIKTFFITLY